MALTKVGPISGFPEFLPSEQLMFKRFRSIIRENYEKYGFVPIETSMVERRDVVSAKEGNEKEIFYLSRISPDSGEIVETDLALHFDLTIPLARYIAMYHNKIAFPFRRYQIGKVWRGNRPQSGRYHEFYQCDIDLIGKGTLSLMADAEIPSVIFNVFKVMDIGRFKIYLNNIKIIKGYLRSLGIGEDFEKTVIKILAKSERVGIERSLLDLEKTVSLERDKAEEIFAFLGRSGQPDTIIASLKQHDFGDFYAQGVEELEAVVAGMKVFGVPQDYFAINLNVARGLNYYTGTVYETKLLDHLGVGSICSGGRYDNLASFFTEEKFPGVGISIGLTRLFMKLMQAGVIRTGSSTVAPVLVSSAETERIAEYINIAKSLRESGIHVENYMEPDSMKKQMLYAHKKGFQVVIIAKNKDFESDNLHLKNMVTGDKKICRIEDIVEEIKKMLPV